MPVRRRINRSMSILSFCNHFMFKNHFVGDNLSFVGVYDDTIGERLGRGIVTDAITTPVVNTSAYFFNKTADLIDFKVPFYLLCSSLLL